MKLWERTELVEEIGKIFNDCVIATDEGLIRIVLQAVERFQEKIETPKFITFFQTVQTTFGPARRDEHGCGYDHRFRSIGVGAVTENGTVWLYSYDYDMSWLGGDALTRWVRADGTEVQQNPGDAVMNAEEENLHLRPVASITVVVPERPEISLPSYHQLLDHLCTELGVPGSPTFAEAVANVKKRLGRK